MTSNNHATAADTLEDEAYRLIKQLLAEKTLVAGQRLIYRDLTKALNMSRTPVVTALNRLEREGFLIRAPFRGFQVKPITAQETTDIWGVREALETYALEQALRAKASPDLSELEAKLEAHATYMPPYYDSRKLFLDADFHVCMTALSGNEAVTRLLKANFEHRCLMYRLHPLDVRRMGPAVEEHRTLFRMFRDGDVPGCVEFLRRHIRTGRDNVLESLSRREALIPF